MHTYHPITVVSNAFGLLRNTSHYPGKKMFFQRIHEEDEEKLGSAKEMGKWQRASTHSYFRAS